MLKNTDSLYFSSVFRFYDEHASKHVSKFWNELASEELPDGAEFLLELTKRISPTRYVSRNGEWSLPWPQEIPPRFEMPAYDPGFSKTFEEVTNNRAIEIKKLINEKNQRFAVMYSGGIDSTLILTSLIKNLTIDELKNIAVAASANSIVENPQFWKKYIINKLTILDTASLKYDSIIEMGYRPITGDEGDSIFGTVFGLGLYANYNSYVLEFPEGIREHLLSIRDKVTTGELHFSNYKDIIIRHLSSKDNPELGAAFYDKVVKNINTSTVPVYSVHDFFWWIIFNLKYMECALRGAIYFNDRLPVKDVIYRWMFNWFNGADYQRWSMVNNNNGEKIGIGLTTYKAAARRYIYSFDSNDWYYHFKCKLDSLGGITSVQATDQLTPTRKPWNRFGIDKDFNLLYIDDADVQEYIKYHLGNYKKDW